MKGKGDGQNTDRRFIGIFSIKIRLNSNLNVILTGARDKIDHIIFSYTKDDRLRKQKKEATMVSG